MDNSKAGLENSIPHNKFLSTFQEENTPEFKLFKEKSQEDEELLKVIRPLINPTIKRILDIGGRDGYIVKEFKDKEITIIDPDPQIAHSNEVKYSFIPGFIQDVDLGNAQYDMIILSHVLGDLGRQGYQKKVIHKLYNESLVEGGYMILFYNTNTSFTYELLSYAKGILKEMRYDYFDEFSLAGLESVKTIAHDIKTLLEYDSYVDLGRCCWMLFATGNDDILDTAKSFVPFLEQKLNNPSFVLDQRIIILQKNVI